MTDLDAKIIKWFGIRGTKGSNIPYLIKRTRYGIAQFLAEHEFNSGVEVGTRRGKYAKFLCDRNPKLRLLCVDPWAPYMGRKYTKSLQDVIYREALQNLASYKNITILRKTSIEALLDVIDRSLDFAFIDGDHGFDAVIMDIICWSRKVHKNGLVIVHDYYHWGKAGVVHAVDAYTRAHHIDPWFVTKEKEPTALWVNSCESVSS